LKFEPLYPADTTEHIGADRAIATRKGGDEIDSHTHCRVVEGDPGLPLPIMVSLPAALLEGVL
jgi:hypothetical protein